MKISVGVVILLSCLILILVSCNPPSGNTNTGSVTPSESVVSDSNKAASQSQSVGDTATKIYKEIPDYNLLAGDWLRIDGGKTIRIKRVIPGGQLDAEYLNPKPIHVGRAEWIIKNNSLFVIIELQDVNYPGSRYALEYFPAEDELAGVYYQAVDKVNYDVGFARQK